MESPRIGFGYDVHRLQEGLPLIIGGVEVPFEKGALGHSDADVLTHAIMDALLGAAGLRDIGQQFPDSEPAYKGADSILLLEKVGEMVRRQGYSIGNIDATVCLQQPKIATLVPEMVQTLSRVLDIQSSRVSVKATTTEGLGFIGSGEGISAYAVALLTG
jgi:2-C-methyl-D-erythritol 2,4-cyclodiphosphate synthase